MVVENDGWTYATPTGIFSTRERLVCWEDGFCFVDGCISIAQYPFIVAKALFAGGRWLLSNQRGWAQRVQTVCRCWRLPALRTNTWEYGSKLMPQGLEADRNQSYLQKKRRVVLALSTLHNIFLFLLRVICPRTIMFCVRWLVRHGARAVMNMPWRLQTKNTWNFGGCFRPSQRIGMNLFCSWLVITTKCARSANPSCQSVVCCWWKERGHARLMVGTTAWWGGALQWQNMMLYSRCKRAVISTTSRLYSRLLTIKSESTGGKEVVNGTVIQ